jgi:ATP-dependent Lon protease
MNLHFKDVFRGKVVNKRLTFNTGMDELPRYVLEYLIDNYCSEETFDKDFAQVKRRLRENFVHGAEAERIHHCIRRLTGKCIPRKAAETQRRKSFHSFGCAYS